MENTFRFWDQNHTAYPMIYMIDAKGRPQAIAIDWEAWDAHQKSQSQSDSD